MTPTDIENQARSLYNATNDTFFTSTEILNLIYKAELELSNECNIIEGLYSTTSVMGQRGYAFPTQTRIVKRVEYIDTSGISVKLEPITFREDDALTLVNTASTTLGKPQFYSTFNFTFYLRPIPDTAGCTIKVYSYGEPQPVSAASILELPTCFHMDVVDFVLMNMYLKDKDPTMAKCYADLWTAAKMRVKRWVQKKKRGDAFTVVQNEDNLAVTLTGPV